MDGSEIPAPAFLHPFALWFPPVPFDESASFASHVCRLLCPRPPSLVFGPLLPLLRRACRAQVWNVLLPLQLFHVTGRV